MVRTGEQFSESIRVARGTPIASGQDTDTLLEIVKKTGDDIVDRAAKFECTAAYASLFFTKPIKANWRSAALPDHSIGFSCDLVQRA